jgi:DNA helicase-2/ATP-dependent DNA helicase PcrA
MMKYPEETQYLSMITEKLQQALNDTNLMIERYQEEYKEAMKYLWEHKSDMDSMEKFSNEKSVGLLVNSGELSIRRRTVLMKLIDSPYFARIDFRFKGDTEAETFYIGRFSYYDKEKGTIIHDWRAPVSGMYYDFELGDAYYEAPVGMIEGEMVKKRQYKIKNSRMEYAIESSVSIRDEVLQRELSNTSDQKMKNIVATIQQEQNRIIRNEKAKVLIIQGVAGSGKTSIALHRVAYFLYKFKGRLAAENIVIISPNKVFADYISNVLPELGEEAVTELSFEDIAEQILEGTITYETPEEQMDKVLTAPEPEYIERLRFKSCEEILSQMENYLNHLKEKHSVLRVGKMLEYYQEFYQYCKRPEMLHMVGGKLEAPDVYPYIYLKLCLESVQCYHDIRHLVIDEMQDYSPIQYAVIKKLFTCRMTLLGDFGQTVNPYNALTKETMLSIFEQTEYVELTTSYRSSSEIIEFSQKILNQRIDPIKRHGEPVRIIPCADWKAECSRLTQFIMEYKSSGYSNLGIICRTKEQAKELNDRLNSEDIHLLDNNSLKFENGIIITTVHMAKGLEFDEVIVPFVNVINYHTDYDRNLLYIACTRSMHKLTLTYHNQLTSFLPSMSEF